MIFIDVLVCTGSTDIGHKKEQLKTLLNYQKTLLGAFVASLLVISGATLYFLGSVLTFDLVCFWRYDVTHCVSLCFHVYIPFRVTSSKSFDTLGRVIGCKKITPSGPKESPPSRSWSETDGKFNFFVDIKIFTEPPLILWLSGLTKAFWLWLISLPKGSGGVSVSYERDYGSFFFLPQVF